MRKYLYDYIKSIDKLIEEKRDINDEVISEHLTKISFFQHERFIHLIVTVFYALFMFIFFGLGLIHWMFSIIAVILTCFVLCYIFHYFKLENGVQYLYKQYDLMKEIYCKEKKH